MKLQLAIFLVCVAVHFGFSAFVFTRERDVDFVLRVRNKNFSDAETFTLETKEKLDNSSFDGNKTVFFLIHGYFENHARPNYEVMSKELLEVADTNLILVDWGKGAMTLNYTLARSKVDDVAKTVAELYSYLNKKFNVDAAKVTCIGFSCGAQICGLTYHHMNDRKFGKIMGLDPAGPEFSVNDSSTRLSPKSATYVECIHTGPSMGIIAPICQADFFFNHGAKQVGCAESDHPICSHYRALEYFNEALRNPKAFYGKPCDSYKTATNGTCEGDGGAFMNHPENIEKNLTGIFQVTTNPRSPFGKGQH